MNKKLSDFKALLFDIDRTLTNTKDEISIEMLNALKQLSKAGYRVGVCTGRGFGSIKHKILPLFPKNSLHIIAGGSQIVNSNDKVVWEHPINPETIQELRNYSKNSEIMYSFKKSDAHYATGQMLINLGNSSHNYIIKDISKMTNDGVGTIFFSNINESHIKYIKNHPNLSYKSGIGNSGKQFLDITAKGVNKLTALRQWSKQTGIPTEKIIGFGDGSNDLEFIKSCGFGVAMGNAVEELKQVSDRVIEHVDNNGLAKYLSKIIKGENL